MEQIHIYVVHLCSNILMYQMLLMCGTSREFVLVGICLSSRLMCKVYLSYKLFFLFFYDSLLVVYFNSLFLLFFFFYDSLLVACFNFSLGGHFGAYRSIRIRVIWEQNHLEQVHQEVSHLEQAISNRAKYPKKMYQNVLNIKLLLFILFENINKFLDYIQTRIIQFRNV